MSVSLQRTGDYVAPLTTVVVAREIVTKYPKAQLATEGIDRVAMNPGARPGRLPLVVGLGLLANGTNNLVQMAMGASGLESEASKVMVGLGSVAQIAGGLTLTARSANVKAQVVGGTLVAAGSASNLLARHVPFQSHKFVNAMATGAILTTSGLVIGKAMVGYHPTLATVFSGRHLLVAGAVGLAGGALVAALESQ